MKTHEKISCVVQPYYLKENDPEFIEKFGFDLTKVLLIDINMKVLVRIDDLYKDTTTFVKTLEKGQGTSSPYNDCVVYSKYSFVNNLLQ